MKAKQRRKALGPRFRRRRWNASPRPEEFGDDMADDMAAFLAEKRTPTRLGDPLPNLGRMAPSRCNAELPISPDVSVGVGGTEETNRADAPRQRRSSYGAVSSSALPAMKSAIRCASPGFPCIHRPMKADETIAVGMSPAFCPTWLKIRWGSRLV